jgi:predicted nucleic acid-binding protein
MIVADASLVAKLIAPEPDSGAAVALVEAEALLAPDLLVAEVGNVIWKRVSRGSLGQAEAEQALRALPAILEPLVSTTSLAGAALRIALRRRHAIYDCFYVALAQREALPLATADRRLAGIAREEGVEVLWPSGPQPSSSA